MTELMRTGLVKHCECFETMNAILHQPKLENFDVNRLHVFGQEVVGQSGAAEWPRGLCKPRGRHCMGRSRDAEPEKL